MNATRRVVLVATALLAAACSGDDRREGTEAREDAADAPAAATSSAEADVADADRSRERTGEGEAALGGPSFVMGEDGSASMHTRNGAMVMALRGDSIVVAFSDSIRTKVRREVAESMRNDSTSESAIGQMIEGVVKSSVSGALGEVFDKSRGFPITSLNGIAYEQGAIRFDFAKRPTWSMDGFETDGTPLLAQFHPADAARFVGAVRARLPH
jgi:hypothetical protein